jgi:hypothetical protein
MNTNRFVILPLLAVAALLAGGCTSGAQTTVKTQATTPTTTPVVQKEYVPEDLGPFKGTEVKVGKSWTKWKKFDVTIDKISVSDNGFGSWHHMQPMIGEKKMVIADITFKAKEDFNLKDYTFALNGDNILYSWGDDVNAPALAEKNKYGIYGQRTDLAVKKGETKTIKLMIKFNDSLLSSSKAELKIDAIPYNLDNYEISPTIDIRSFVK